MHLRVRAVSCRSLQVPSEAVRHGVPPAGVHGRLARQRLGGQDGRGGAGAQHVGRSLTAWHAAVAAVLYRWRANVLPILVAVGGRIAIAVPGATTAWRRRAIAAVAVARTMISWRERLAWRSQAHLAPGVQIAVARGNSESGVRFGAPRVAAALQELAERWSRPRLGHVLRPPALEGRMHLLRRARRLLQPLRQLAPLYLLGVVVATKLRAAILPPLGALLDGEPARRPLVVRDGAWILLLLLIGVGILVGLVVPHVSPLAAPGRRWRCAQVSSMGRGARAVGIAVRILFERTDVDESVPHNDALLELAAFVGANGPVLGSNRR
mmetsp:Transcript_41390/g.119091  ORF Transcript_41390/g.119091 Transcript_41390/m.119091 type:complete len:324 (+) Transcript_41390:1179-2150(+)